METSCLKNKNCLITGATGGVGKEVSIPGFRKGKVPREVIEKNYKDQIKDQSNYKLVLSMPIK